ncbi:hypothetical protein L7F22_036578 [Adiantum nelumboides]|nr:hypothetical protein [Adiantum nelumboides]
MYIEHFYLEVCIAQRSISKSYVKSRTLKWWKYYAGFVQGDEQRLKSIFKLPLTLFENLVELPREQLQQGKIPESFVSIQGRVLSVEKQVAIGIFCLATSTSTMAISELFGVGKSTVVETINHFVHAFLVHQCNFIAWPKSLSRISTRSSQVFQLSKAYLMCVGLWMQCTLSWRGRKVS